MLSIGMCGGSTLNDMIEGGHLLHMSQQHSWDVGARLTS